MHGPVTMTSAGLVLCAPPSTVVPLLAQIPQGTAAGSPVVVMLQPTAGTPSPMTLPLLPVPVMQPAAPVTAPLTMPSLSPAPSSLGTDGFSDSSSDGICSEPAKQIPTPPSPTLPCPHQAVDTGRNLIINGLSPHMDADWLESTFKSWGEIESVHVVCDVETGRSKGYGFVKYVECAAAQKAMAGLCGTVPPGSTKQLKVSIARQQEATAEKQSLNVYIGGFREALSAADLTKLCRRYGQVVDCKVLCLRYHSDGVAFVKFANIQSAAACCSGLNGSAIASPTTGKRYTLTCRFADKLGKSRQSKADDSECPKLLRRPCDF